MELKDIKSVYFVGAGFPYLIQVINITVHVATAGATVVVAKIVANCRPFVAAAPLNPYHPNHKMKHPNAPIVKLCPGIPRGLPSLSNFPILGPNIQAPIKAGNMRKID